MSMISLERDGPMRDPRLPDSAACRNLRLCTRFARLPLLLAAVLAAACLSMPAAAERSASSSGHERRSIVPSSRIGPATDAAEALRRLMALIDTLREQQDLTPQRVADLSGLTLLEDPRSPERFMGHQGLTDAWSYGYQLWPEFHTQQTVFAFRFHADPHLNPRRPPKTEICSLDMDQFHDALLGMGFANTRNVLSGYPERRYRRGHAAVDVHYTGESAVRVTHDCVDRVFVAFVSGDEALR